MASAKKAQKRMEFEKGTQQRCDRVLGVAQPCCSKAGFGEAVVLVRVRDAGSTRGGSGGRGTHPWTKEHFRSKDERDSHPWDMAGSSEWKQ